MKQTRSHRTVVAEPRRPGHHPARSGPMTAIAAAAVSAGAVAAVGGVAVAAAGTHLIAKVIAIATLVTTIGGGVAAVTGSLPDPIQTWVADRETPSESIFHARDRDPRTPNGSDDSSVAQRDGANAADASHGPGHPSRTPAYHDPQTTCNESVSPTITRVT